MKRGLLILLVFTVILSLAACGVKETVQNKTREMLGGLADIPEATDKTSAEEGSPAPSEPAASGERRPIAQVPPGHSYMERIENEWLNAPEVGYVWTITINDVDVIDVMGLCTATYNVNLSASHIGEDMFGVYFGEFGFDYSADMGGLSALLTLQGGSVEYDTDGWFKNDEFMFKLSPYELIDEEVLEAIVNVGSEYEGMSDDERAYMDALMAQIYDLDNEEQFEKDSDAVAMWWAFDMPMTDGDMSGYFQMNGVLGGIVDGKGEVDSSGKNVAADVRVAFGLYANGSMIGKFDERYSETDTFENPIPYTIKVYPDNNVVMTLYSSTGGPVTTKCYGTIDKIPISDTVAVRP